jgi:cellulose synthase/poly-beta-1,6-N-acetylglucosamine synthase-like glycosyltransferase
VNWEDILVVVYTTGLVFITLYSVAQIHLLVLYYRWKRNRPQDPAPLAVGAPDAPHVTVQIALYNEAAVTAQVIDAVAGLEWPSDRLEIQVVDDSTDESVAIALERIAHWRGRGLDIVHCRRENREGYKAGALAAATPKARGEFVALFDADFLPAPDFLRALMPWFDGPRVGMVQARWGHLNRDESPLTRVQAILLDGFYLIEQPARQHADYFTRFNGAGGIWRKECITDAGGWSGDTLAEDLDLCFRAQLKGWTMRYAHDVVAPAELPPSLDAFKKQQYRWTRGKAQVIRKLTVPILKARLPFMVKVHAFVDLLNVLAYISALAIGILSVPLSWILFRESVFPQYMVDTSFALLPLFVWIWLVVAVLRFQNPGRGLVTFLRDFPVVLVTVLGITYYQTLALIRGMAGPSGEFSRTPKFGVAGGRSRSRLGRLGLRTMPPETVAEFALAAYFLFGLWIDLRFGGFAFLPLHVALTVSYAFVAIRSWIPSVRR